MSCSTAGSLRSDGARRVTIARQASRRVRWLARTRCGWSRAACAAIRRDHGLCGVLADALGHGARHELADHGLREAAGRRAALCRRRPRPTRPSRHGSIMPPVALAARSASRRKSWFTRGPTSQPWSASASRAGSSGGASSSEAQGLARWSPAIYALLVLFPGNAFSQREHIGVCLFLPMLVLMAWRMRAGSPRPDRGDGRSRRPERQRAASGEALLRRDGPSAGACDLLAQAKPASSLRRRALGDRRCMRGLSRRRATDPPGIPERRLSASRRRLCQRAQLSADAADVWTGRGASRPCDISVLAERTACA